MCSECYGELEELSFGVNRTIKGVNVYCAGVYDKQLQKLIRGLKYHGKRDLAYYLAKFMWEYFKDYAEGREFQIVPTPLFPTREKKRHYNHMKLVANELSLLSGFKVNSELVKRVKDTAPQYKLKRTERMENLKNAFKVDDSSLPCTPILIIDDLCTTGATFEEMISTLQSSGVENVVCLAAATP